MLPYSLESRVALDISSLASLITTVVSLAFRYSTFILRIKRSWTLKHSSVDPWESMDSRLGTTGLLRATPHHLSTVSKNVLVDVFYVHDKRLWGLEIGGLQHVVTIAVREVARLRYSNAAPCLFWFLGHNSRQALRIIRANWRKCWKRLWHFQQCFKEFSRNAIKESNPQVTNVSRRIKFFSQNYRQWLRTCGGAGPSKFLNVKFFSLCFDTFTSKILETGEKFFW